MLIAACTAPDNRSTEENLTSYLSQDSTLKMTDDEMTALSGIHSESKQITSTRQRALTSDSVTKHQEPTLPAGKIAGVIINAENKTPEYTGSYMISFSANNRIIGTLGDSSKLSITYRLPEKQTADIRANKTYALLYKEGVVDGSLSRLVMLTEQTKIHFGVIEQGSNELYTATFKDQNLTIRQLASKDKKTYPVEIQYNNEKFTMNPGEQQARGDTKFYLQTSTGVEGNPVGLEGQAFFVRMYVYKFE